MQKTFIFINDCSEEVQVVVQARNERCAVAKLAKWLYEDCGKTKEEAKNDADEGWSCSEATVVL